MAWIIDPATGKLVNDTEFEPVQEGMPDPKSGLLRRAVGDTVTSAAKGLLVGVPQAAVGLARVATLGAADSLLDPVSNTLSDMGKRFDKAYSPEHAKQAEEVQATKGFFPTMGAYLSRPGYLADTVVEQLPGMFAGGAAGKAVMGAKSAVAGGAVGEGLITAGQNVEQIHEQTGQNSTVGQKLIGAASGLTTGMLSFGAGKLAKRFDVTDIDTMMAGGGAATGAAGKLLPSMAKGFMGEAAEETAQSATEQMWTNTALNRPLTEGVAEAAGAGAILGGVMGAGVQTLNRPDPAAMLHNKRMSDALAGIQLLSATSEEGVTKDHDAALRAVSSYARSVDPDFDVNAWRQEAMAEISAGRVPNFDGVPGITSDAAAKQWAENRIAEIKAREVAAQPAVDSTRAVTDDMGTEQIIADAPYQPEVAGRPLRAQEKAEIAKLEAAIASGDAQAVAKLQNKLAYLPQEVAAPAGAAAPTTTPAAPAAAAPPVPADPIREFRDSLKAVSEERVAAGGKRINAGTTTGAINNVAKLAKKENIPLSEAAERLAKAEIMDEDKALVYAKYAEFSRAKEAENVQAAAAQNTQVDPGAKPDGGDTQGAAAVLETPAGQPAQGDATGQPTQKAKEKVAPVSQPTEGAADGQGQKTEVLSAGAGTPAPVVAPAAATKKQAAPSKAQKKPAAPAKPAPVVDENKVRAAQAAVRKDDTKAAAAKATKELTPDEISAAFRDTPGTMGLVLSALPLKRRAAVEATLTEKQLEDARNARKADAEVDEKGEEAKATRGLRPVADSWNVLAEGSKLLPTWEQLQDFISKALSRTPHAEERAALKEKIEAAKAQLAEVNAEQRARDRALDTRVTERASREKALAAAELVLEQIEVRLKKASVEAGGKPSAAATRVDRVLRDEQIAKIAKIEDALDAAKAAEQKARAQAEDKKRAATTTTLENEIQKAEDELTQLRGRTAEDARNAKRAKELTKLAKEFEKTREDPYGLMADRAQLLRQYIEARFEPVAEQMRKTVKKLEKAIYDSERYATAVGQFVEDQRANETEQDREDSDAAIDAVADRNARTGVPLEDYLIDSAETSAALKLALTRVSGTKQMNQVLGVISKMADNHMHRNLADMLRNIGANGVKVVYSSEPGYGKTKDGHQYPLRGRFNRPTNTITIFPGGENAHTILHEVVHALTSHAIEKATTTGYTENTKFGVEMRRRAMVLNELYTAIKGMPNFANEYAAKNVYEFVAEVFSNPALQEKLAKTPIPKLIMDKMGPDKGIVATLMDAFVAAVRYLLKLPRGSQNALTKAIELSSPFFAKNTGGKQGIGIDALGTPAAAMAVVPENLRNYMTALDTKLATTPFADVKASAYKVWLGLVSSDYIKGAVDRMPALAGVKTRIEDWFAADQRKTQVKNLISKEVYDGFMRKLGIELQRTGDPTKYSALMAELGGGASIFGIDLRKNFDQNNVGRGGKGQQAKLDPGMKGEINKLHQQFMSLQQSPKTRKIAEMLLEGEKVNRKLHTMNTATGVLNILRQFASTNKAPEASQHLLNKYEKALDILQDSKKLKNTNAGIHIDALSAHLHTQLEQLFADVSSGPLARGDLHDDLKFIQKAYMTSWEAPYMHLGRHGDYSVRFVVADTSAKTTARLNELLKDMGFVFSPFTTKDGTVFLRMEKLADMNKVEQIMRAHPELLQKVDGKPNIAASLLSDIGLENMFGVSKAMSDLRARMADGFSELKKMQTKSPALKQAYDDIQAMLTQQFVDMLDKDSARQANQLSKHRPGFSSDYMRSFGKRAQWAEATIATQYTTQAYTEAFRGMDTAIAELSHDDSKMAVRGQSIVDELSTRFSNSLKPNNSPVATMLSTFGHNFYLALSPAYFIGNMLQPYMITLPMLGGRFGFVKSSKAMGRATADTTSLITQAVKDGWAEGGWRGVLDTNLDPSKANLTREEMDFMQHLIRSGIVDATQAQELGRLAKGTSSAAATAARTLSVTNHYSEVLNRLSAGLAAYRLAKGDQRPGGKVSPEQYAIDVVRRTQYDYSDHVQARYLSRHGVFGSMTPLFFQFQTFAFRTMEHYLRMVKDGFIERDLKPEERADARKALAYTLGATATIAGTMGLPFASVFFALANAGDDDKDARARYREWLAGHLGKDLAELAAKGVLPRGVLGIDMSGQVGHQDLLPGSRWMSDRRNFEDKVKDQSRTLLGPALNAGFDIYGGMSKAADGDVVAGIRTMLPRALKGPMEAAITANEGAFVNKAGNTLPVPATSWDYLKLAAGFQPQKKAEQSEANFYYQSEMTQRKQDKAKAKKDAMRMMKDGDYDGAAEHVAEFNAANPGNALTGISQAMMSQARAQAYASMSGTGILEGNKRHFPMMGAYGTWANTGIDAGE